MIWLFSGTFKSLASLELCEAPAGAIDRPIEPLLENTQASTVGLSFATRQKRSWSTFYTMDHTSS